MRLRERRCVDQAPCAALAAEPVPTTVESGEPRRAEMTAIA
jgi:hypothetical protein